MIGPQPPPFDPARSHLLAGSLLNTILRAIRRQPIPGPGISIQEDVDGNPIISAKAAGGTGLTGYILLYQETIGSGPDIVSRLYVRLVNGLPTELLDGWDGAVAVDPPTEWGDMLFYLNTPPIGALLYPNTPWSFG